MSESSPPEARSTSHTSGSDAETVALELLREHYPGTEYAAAEAARLRGELARRKGAVHVLSDIHGEDGKLRHVINNASGTLRPVVERLFAARRTPAELRELLTLIFYPHESLERGLVARPDPAQRAAWFRKVLLDLLEVTRALARHSSFEHVERVLPDEYRGLLRELLSDATAERGGEYVDAIVGSLSRSGHDGRVIRVVARALRNLAVTEIVIAGDCWDRGPRGDRVVEYLLQQPKVAFTWGNHDVAWIGAALGCPALIAHVLRISLRYRRLSQLEEGYGITLQPLEKLARDVYANDPAEHFHTRGKGLRDDLQMARMHKAAAILQHKLEGQLIQRHPEYELEHRRLLGRMDLRAGTVEIDGTVRSLKDSHLPTLDPSEPYRLSAAEEACMERIRRSFLGSSKLWEHIRFMVRNGGLHLVRDRHLVFHGCVPVDDGGEFLSMPVGGVALSGRALFDALKGEVAQSLEHPTEARLDLLWYLWCGPRSPLFGKDRITTFERDFVADTQTYEEHKNAYFTLIHDAPFCDRILAEFGVDPEHGLIVNGHVPVKIEKGESPVKRSGKAVTIDGAFSEAYGDHGYTLVIDADGTSLAMHHHFDSVEAAVRDGVDIIPAVSVIRRWESPRRVGDTEDGARLRGRIALLDRLSSSV